MQCHFASMVKLCVRPTLQPCAVSSSCLALHLQPSMPRRRVCIFNRDAPFLQLDLISWRVRCFACLSMCVCVCGGSESGIAIAHANALCIQSQLWCAYELAVSMGLCLHSWHMCAPPCIPKRVSPA